MKFRIIFSPLARLDVKQSVEWYDEQSDGLGDNFLSAIDEELTIISSIPEAFSKRKGNIRQKPLKKFPFIIVYTIVDEEHINIARIFHTSRNPKLKYKKK